MKQKDTNNCVNFNKSAIAEQCDNTGVEPINAPAGLGILNVPVLLTEINVSSSLVDNIRLPELALEIKDIKKRVKITQCRLMTPPTATPGTFAAGDFQLYIAGFIRKNIQYASPRSTGKCINSDMRSFTIDVPFQCVTTIESATLRRPIQLPVANTRTEYDFFTEQNLGTGFPEKDHLLSSDLSQYHQANTQFYNKLPYCEIVSHNINGWVESTDREPLPGNAPFEEGAFRNLVEKTFLQFTVKVLQEQQVRVDIQP